MQCFSFWSCYARRESRSAATGGRIRFATFAPLAVRNSGYISRDLDGREKYLTKFLFLFLGAWRNPVCIRRSFVGANCVRPRAFKERPYGPKNGFTKNSFNILQSVPKCAIINLLIGDGTHNKKQHRQKANHYKGGDTHRKKRNCC